MAVDEALADRLRARLAGEPDVEERRMFGGVAFLAGGHLAVCASGQGGLMVRADGPLDDPGVTPMEMRGRPMSGWLRVTSEAVAGDAALRAWTARGLATARALPPKG